MSNVAQAAIDAARMWKQHHFSSAHYGASPYCASFVRWCYERATGIKFGLPEARRIPYYERKRIHVQKGLWFADSLAGDEIGPLVRSQQPGDLLFFRNTASGPWPVGSITHVGIAVDHRDMIADAGSGSLVHFRSHASTFPGLLVEIRRPKVIGHGAAQSQARTAIHISRGQAFAMRRGTHVRGLTIEFASVEGSADAANARGYHSAQTASVAAHSSQGSAGAGFHWEISVDGNRVKPVRSFQVDLDGGGHRFKLFAHDDRASGFLDGAPLKGAIRLKLEARNGMAHVWLDGREIKTTKAEVEVFV
jgi:hypothetical protein